MRRILWFLEFLLLLIVTFPLAVLPSGLALKAGAVLGDLLYLFWAPRRKIAVENLRGAVIRGAVAIDRPVESVIRENFRNLGCSFAEVVKIYYGLGGRIFAGVRVEGAENFRKALAKGRGIMLITGHCGNWELNALACSEKICSINIVARPVNNPFLNKLIEAARRKYGNRVIYKKGALKEILSALKRNEAVGILMDQSVLLSEGVMADFLGKTDSIMKTPALIAMKTGCAVLPAFIKRTAQGHVIHAGEEIELDTSSNPETAVFNNSVAFSKRIEEYIAENPAEWLWMHRRWKRVDESAFLAGPEPLIKA